MTEPPINRRPLKSRQTAWAHSLARLCARLKIKPNTISLFSAVFALLAGAGFTWSSHQNGWRQALLLVLSAICIQLRLLCNLLDGMIAIEGGQASSTGELFNDIPDRFADAFILIGSGYAASSHPFGAELGWIAALLAIITAYVRYLGAAMGAGMNFLGPMAKPHRMATLTIAALAQAACLFIFPQINVIYLALLAIVLGALITIYRRIRRIVITLEQQ